MLLASVYSDDGKPDEASKYLATALNDAAAAPLDEQV